MNTDNSKNTFRTSQKMPGINDRKPNGALQPPRKNVAAKAEIENVPLLHAIRTRRDKAPDEIRIALEAAVGDEHRVRAERDLGAVHFGNHACAAPVLHDERPTARPASGRQWQ